MTSSFVGMLVQPAEWNITAAHFAEDGFVLVTLHRAENADDSARLLAIHSGRPQLCWGTPKI